MKLTRYLLLLTMLFTACPHPIVAAVIDPVWDGIFDDSDTHYFLPSDGSSVRLAETPGSIQSSLRERYAVFEFPIAGLEPGPRKLRFTLTEKPSGKAGDPFIISKAHELSIRVQAGDGVVTFADFFNIPPDVDAQAMADGWVALGVIRPAGYRETFTNQPSIDIVTYQVADADAGTVLESDTAAFSNALNELILQGHTHAMVLLQFDSIGFTEIATLENDLYPSAQIVLVPEPSTAALIGLSALFGLGRRRRRR